MMRIFVTGASGHIGAPLVADLLDAGHEVLGLARSDASAGTLEAAGAAVHRGDLRDLDSLRDGAKQADGVIHLAFQHDLMQSGRHGDAAADDLRAVEAFGEVLAGTDQPFVNTTGTLMLSQITGRPSTEDDVLESGVRIDSENATIALAANGVRSSVIRLAPTVHSSLDHHGFVPAIIGMARDKGVSPYVGDGDSHWPAVHTIDAARLYRLAVESAPPGTRLHGVADEGVPFREIAETIGRKLDLPVRSISPDEAGDHFGFLATFVQLDNVTCNAKTRELLDWQPTHPGLIDDLNEGHYFK